jgi:O-antigen/teichoic acid export membrane protein
LSQLEVDTDSKVEPPADDSQVNPPDKSALTTSKRSVVKNMIWNWAGVAVEAAVGLIMAPFLIRTLGDDIYGVWIVIGSLAGYFGMLDLGMRGAVGRFVAMRLQQNDRRGIEEVLGTAVAALLGVSAIAIVLLFVLSQFTSRIFGIGPERSNEAATAMMIVAVQLGIFFFTRLFDATLWAMQRFDLLNKIDIPTTLFRAGSTYLLVRNGGGLIAMAWISLICIVVPGVLKLWFTYKLLPGLRVQPKFATRSMFRQLVDFGFWNFIIAIAVMARTQLIPLSIGAIMGAAAVVPFSLVTRLIGLSSVLSNALTGVFAPIAIKLFAKQDEQGCRRLVDEGGRLGLCLGIYFAALFICLGGPLFAIWIRPDFAQHGVILSILGLGEVVPLAMALPQAVIQAMARHKRLAVLAILEAVCAIGGGGACCYVFGLTGGAIFIAASAVLFRGLNVWLTYSKVTHTPIFEALGHIFTRPLISAIVPVAVLQLAVLVRTPSNWFELFAYGIGFTLLYGVFAVFVVVGWKEARSLLSGNKPNPQNSQWRPGPWKPE